MPYCKSCGAYIPDGLSSCLACGYDENAKQAAAAAKSQSTRNTAQSDDMREILERHRKLQQEKNRQWAESERERREKQAENTRWAQEEYARRQAEREVEAERRQQESRAYRETEQTARQADPIRTSTGTGNRGLAAISYLSFLFLGPLLFAPEDDFAKYHAKQGLRLFIFGAVTDLIASIIPFGFVLTLFRIYCIYKGMSNALNGKKEPLPYIGTIGGN